MSKDTYTDKDEPPNDHVKSNHTNRRSVLKASGAIFSLAAAQGMIKSVSAEQRGQQLGKAAVVDLHLEHVGISKDVPVGNTHFWPRYRLDIEKNAFVFTTIAPDKQRQYSRQGGLLAYRYGNSVRHLSGADGDTIADLFSNETPTSLTLDAGRSVFLANEYIPPSVRVHRKGDEAVRVSVQDRQVDLHAGEQKKIELSPVTVQLYGIGKGWQTTPGKPGEEPMRVPKPGPIVDETVTPVLKMENYGQLDIYDSKKGE
ncbi:hypothetical protein ACFQH6_03475 [Halobacteriaceae archaeon GCM10025711]